MIPGLPDRRYYGNLQWLKPEEVYTLLRQLHNAKRAGRHTDVRIGSPDFGLFSWAAPKDLPMEGQKRLLITQPLHTWSYKDFLGPIYSKYGQGTVKKLLLSPIVILQNTPDKIKFTRADKRNAPIYTMIKTRNNNWLTTVQSDNAPTAIKTYSKLHFKNISLLQAADMLDQGATAYPKIDGAAALAVLLKKGIDVYGVNKDKYGQPIKYTNHIGGLRDISIPKDLVGKTLRVEVSGRLGNKPIKANTLAGLLNASLQKNIETRKQKNIQLYLTALALNQGKDIYDKAAVNTIVSKINSGKLVGLPLISTRQQLAKHIALMREGKHPLTQLGIIVQKAGERPVKAKLLSDYDVLIKDIFPARISLGVPRAGGFTYTLPGGSKELGRVGTGFTHELLIDMLNNPKLYRGKLARITAMDQYPSGAYRAPVFQAIRSLGD